MYLCGRTGSLNCGCEAIVRSMCKILNKSGVTDINAFTFKYTADKKIRFMRRIENAAKKFIRLAEEILKGEKKPNLFNDGVCSKAEILKDNWYKTK